MRMHKMAAYSKSIRKQKASIHVHVHVLTLQKKIEILDGVKSEKASKLAAAYSYGDSMITVQVWTVPFGNLLKGLVPCM